MNSIVSLLKDYITEEGIKQTKVAEILSVYPTTLNSWLKGKKTPSRIKQQAIINYLTGKKI